MVDLEPGDEFNDNKSGETLPDEDDWKSWANLMTVSQFKALPYMVLTLTCLILRPFSWSLCSLDSLELVTSQSSFLLEEWQGRMRWIKQGISFVKEIKLSFKTRSVLMLDAMFWHWACSENRIWFKTKQLSRKYREGHNIYNKHSVCFCRVCPLFMQCFLLSWMRSLFFSTAVSCICRFKMQ